MEFEIKYSYVTDAAALGQIANELSAASIIGLDTETEGFDPYRGRVRLLSLNIDGKVYVIDLFQTGTLSPLDAAMRECKGIYVLQNAKFDQKWLWHHYKIKLNFVFDTMRASYVIYNGLDKKHDLYSLYDRELDLDPIAQDLGGSNWSGPLSKEQLDYAAEDVILLPLLRTVLRNRLIKGGLADVGFLEMQVVYPEARMELAGFRLDSKMWLEVAEANRQREYQLRLELLRELPTPGKQGWLFSVDSLESPLGPPFLGARELEQTGDKEDPEDDDTLIAQLFRERKKGKGSKSFFNIESNKQVLEALQAKDLRQDGKLINSTSEIVLASYASEHAVVRKLLKHREYATRLKMFGPDYLKFVHPITGRIHGSLFAFTGAGRYAMRHPNLMQLPRSKDVRACFRPKPGKKLVIADLSQVELRMMAQLSGDTALISAYQAGRDIHKQTAEDVTGIKLSTVSEERAAELRQLAKAINFGFIYGLGAAKFVLYAQASYGVTISLKEAERIRTKYFEIYSGVKKWQEYQLNVIKPTGEVRTLSGRRRFLDPAFNHNNFMNCLDAETEALTQRGWVRGFDLMSDDILLTKNKDTGVLEWQALTGLRFFPEFEGELVEFRTRNFSAVSTLNHRWLVTNKATGTSEVRVSESLSTNGDHRIHRTGTYIGVTSSAFTDDFVELLGWFLTDGTYAAEGRVKLCQSERGNPELVKTIDALLNRIDPKAGRYYYGEKSQFLVTWRLTKAISDKLHLLAPDRVLTSEILLNLTGQQAKLLVDTMLLGDGSGGSGEKRVLHCGTQHKANQFQALCVLAGIATSSHERDMSGYSPKSTKMLNIPKMNTIWNVTLLERDKVQIQRQHKKVYKSKQPVWCPMVPNTFFVARREGQVFITGNTPDQGSCADGLKLALCLLQNKLDTKYAGRAEFVLSVHDEIIIEADDDADMLPELLKDLEQCMVEGTAKYVNVVPVKAEGGYGKSWADKK